MSPITVLCGALTMGKPSADSPEELVGWAASGDTRFWEQERGEPATTSAVAPEPPFSPSYSGSGSEEKKGGCFLQILGFVSLKDKEGRAPKAAVENTIEAIILRVKLFCLSQVQGKLHPLDESPL